LEKEMTCRMPMGSGIAASDDGLALSSLNVDPAFLS
jgi:hypothetical protein